MEIGKKKPRKLANNVFIFNNLIFYRFRQRIEYVRGYNSVEKQKTIFHASENKFDDKKFPKEIDSERIPDGYRYVILWNCVCFFFC